MRVMEDPPTSKQREKNVLPMSINAGNLNVGNFIIHILRSIIIVKSRIKAFFLLILFTMAKHSRDHRKTGAVRGLRKLTPKILSKSNHLKHKISLFSS